MRARTRLIKIQRSLYDRLKGYARGILGGLSPELRRYYLEYQKDFRVLTEISSQSEILGQALESDLILCGDYHTLAQAQRTLLRLMQAAFPHWRAQGRPVIVALEMFRAIDQAKLDAFLDRKLSEFQLLRAIRFRKTWGFPWRHYRPLLIWARENGIRVMGITDGRNQRLTRRDTFAAKRLLEIRRAHPTAVIHVLMGDLHLAANHLPKAIRATFKKARMRHRQLVIHQNHEGLFWRLTERKLEHRVEALRMGAGVYCVFNSPPWVKLQSHLQWNELVSEAKHTRVHSWGEALAAIDYESEVREVSKLLAEFLQIDPPADDEFAICDPRDREQVQTLVRGLSKREQAQILLYSESFDSFYVPQLETIFLGNLNLNHVATQAALHLHSRLSGFNRIFLDAKKDFFPFIWFESLGYLGSKVINPGRRDLTLHDLVSASKRLEGRSDEKSLLHREVFSRTLQCWEAGPSTPTFASWLKQLRGPSGTLKAYKVARLLGKRLGELLYQNLVAGNFPSGHVVALLKRDLSPQEAHDAYYDSMHLLTLKLPNDSIPDL